METYHQSILEYYDVRQVANYAEKEGVKKGLRKGRKEGIEIGEKRGEKRGIEIGEKRGAEQERIKLVKSLYANNVSIEIIAQYTGCTKKQIHNILNNE